MVKSRKLLFILIAMMAFVSPVASFGFEDWQADLDTDNRGNLTVQQYDVYTLPYGTQGSSTSAINWNNNVAAWENRNIIFDSERLFKEPYYATAQISTKREGRNLDIIFYNNRANYGDASKQSLKAWGYFVPQTTGYYRFKIESDDGAYAEIYTRETDLNHSKSEAIVLIDNMNVSFYNDGQSPIVQLQANKAYPIYLEYFNWGGDGLFTLKYAKSTNYSTVNNNPYYEYVGKDMLYPSKKDDFFKQHGSVSGLVPVLNNAKAFYSDYLNSQDPDILALKNLIDKADLIIREYYNYSQAEIDKAISELNAQMKVIKDIDVAVKQPYPDDLLLNSKGMITVQTYDVKDLKSVYEAGSSREENVKTWTNENIVFSEDRKNGVPKLYTAEIIKNTVNAAVNEIFFYDGGGDFGYDAKEAREGWGYLVPNRTGYYDFKSLFDDGIKAFIYLNENDLKHYDNEKTVLANYYDIGTFTKQSGSMYLEAGKPYPIYINHYNWHGPNRLALQYRYSTSASGLTGAFKDTPASWFYGSDKNDFLMIHGDKSNLVSKIADARTILNGSNTLSEDQKSRLKDLLSNADLMVDKYYNYQDVEFNNMIKSINDIISGSTTGSSKIKKYIKGDREYIEVLDEFNEASIDKKLWKSSNYGRSQLASGMLYADPNSKLIVDELFNDYDHIEISVDQIYNGTVFKGGIGLTGNKGDIVQHLFNVYYRKHNSVREYANTGMEGYHWFDVNNHQNYTTKIIADKDVNGKYKVSLKIFDYYNNNSQLIYIDNYSEVNTVDHFLLNQIMLGTRRADGYNYANTNLYSIFDNFKIYAYKELNTLSVSIKDFSATTVGNNIKLSWATTDTDFDTFEIRELVDGKVVRVYSNIPKTQREKSDINIGGTYNNRVFEIIAKKGNRYSATVSTTWYGGIETSSITGFNNTNQQSSILLSWESPVVGLYDGFNLYEIKNGVEVYLGKADKLATSYSVSNVGNETSRTFRIRGYKGNNLSNSSETIWEEPIVTLVAKNFKAVTSITGTQISLSWDKPSVYCDGYMLYEFVNGEEKLISKITGSSNNNYNVPMSSNLGDRDFRVYIYRGTNKSKASDTTWVDVLKTVSITGLVATTSNDDTSVVLSWTKPQGDFDQYKLIEYVDGIASQPIVVDKNAISVNVPLNGNQSDRTYQLYAVKNGRDSKPATALWTNPIKNVKVEDFQSSNASNGSDIILSWTKPNADITGYKIYEIINGVEVLVKDINDPNTLTTAIPHNNNLSNRKFRIYAVKDSLKSKPTDTIWDDGIKLVSITDFKGTNFDDQIKLTWATNSSQIIDGFKIYEVIDGVDVLLRTLSNTTTELLLPLNTENKRTFKINAFRGSKVSGSSSCEWRDIISTNNKDNNKGQYVDLEGNIKFTKHDSSFGIAVEINVDDAPIYSPSLEFKIEGNKYLTYENPKVYLYNSKKERISSKVIIEYDANQYIYKVQILPLGLSDNSLTKGVYYANLETRTIVNTDNYSQNQLASFKTPKIKDWELAYYIEDLVDPNTSKKIIDGLGIDFNINYKVSNTSTVQRSINADKIILNIENKIVVPGGY